MEDIDKLQLAKKRNVFAVSTNLCVPSQIDICDDNDLISDICVLGLHFPRFVSPRFFVVRSSVSQYNLYRPS